ESVIVFGNLEHKAGEVSDYRCPYESGALVGEDMKRRVSDLSALRSGQEALKTLRAFTPRSRQKSVISGQGRLVKKFTNLVFNSSDASLSVIMDASVSQTRLITQGLSPPHSIRPFVIEAETIPISDKDLVIAPTFDQPKVVDTLGDDASKDIAATSPKAKSSL
ncbi:unnamed protein product, partial [Ilex paraguariensis]